MGGDGRHLYRRERDADEYDAALPYARSPRAERLRARREELTGQPCFIVPMAAWRADPGGALRRARAERRETDRIG